MAMYEYNYVTEEQHGHCFHDLQTPTYQACCKCGGMRTVGSAAEACVYQLSKPTHDTEQAKNVRI